MVRSSDPVTVLHWKAIIILTAAVNDELAQGPCGKLVQFCDSLLVLCCALAVGKLRIYFHRLASKRHFDANVVSTCSHHSNDTRQQPLLVRPTAVHFRRYHATTRQV